MAHRVLNRVQEITTTNGEGSLYLGGATERMVPFVDAGVLDGDTFAGLIEHATEPEWELALCTLHEGSRNYISRAASRDSSDGRGATVNFSTGQKRISIVQFAKDGPRRISSGVSTEAEPSNLLIVIDKAEAGSHAVILPSLSLLVPGDDFIIIDGKGDAEANPITITDADGAGINGVSSIVMSANYERQRVLFDGEKLLLV